MKRNREETYQSRVERCIRESDDLLTREAIARRTGIPLGVVDTSLRNLQRVRGGDNVYGVSEHGKGFHWFLTPDSDTRNRRIPEVPHGEHRQKRRTKKHGN